MEIPAEVHQQHTFHANPGAPTPNFLSMRGPNHVGGGSKSNRYSDEVEAGANAQYTNADVNSIMGPEEMLSRQHVSIPNNDTSMVQDQDL